MKKKKCRVFSRSIGWSDAMFIFDEDIKFSDMNKNPQTHMLTKDDYIGTYEFDKNFVKLFNKNQIGNKIYFTRFSYHKDNTSPEEQKWKNVPEFIEPKKNEIKEYKNIETKPNESNANDSLF